MRKEKDLLGTLMVPEEAYYGIQTQRAVMNFSVSGQTAGGGTSTNMNMNEVVANRANELLTGEHDFVIADKLSLTLWRLRTG